MWHDTILGIKLPWPDHCHLQLGTPCSYYGIWVTHLLPSGFTWFWQSLGDPSLLLVPLFLWGAALPTSPNPTTQLYLWGGTFPDSFLVVPACAILLQGKDKVGASVFFAPLLHLLDSGLNSCCLSPPSPRHTFWYVTSFFGLPGGAVSMCHSNPSIAKYYPLSSSNYKTLPIASPRVSAHSLSTVLRDWNLLSLTLKKKPFAPPIIPFNTPMLAV